MKTQFIEAVTVTLNPAVDCMATVAGFTAGAVNRVSTYLNQPGGKGVNVALSLSGLGHQVAATGWLGKDNAALFEEQFAVAGVSDEFVRIAGSTRVSVKISDPDKQETTDINFPGLSPDHEAQRQLLIRLDTLQTKWFVLSGSLPEGIAPDIYASMIHSLKKRGIKVLLDTSGKPLREALKAPPAIIKPNIHELSELVGEPLDTQAKVRDAALDIVNKGVALVVVSMGEEGALFVTAKESLLARPPDIPVISTVGAGDAMVAGIIAGQLRGLDLEGQARLATASSLHVLTRKRELSGVPYDLTPYLNAVMIT